MFGKEEDIGKQVLRTLQAQTYVCKLAYFVSKE
jgi:hypothetical protein